MAGIRILLYHSVGRIDKRDSLGIRVDIDNFRRQMEFIKGNGFNILDLKDVVQYIDEGASLPDNGLVITFDDGYRDNIVNAVPIMEEFGIKATFFITVSFLGTTKTHPDREWQHWRCMEWMDLREIAERGHRIGSHCMHHVDLRSLTGEAAKKELLSSRDELSSSLGIDIDTFSYPYGFYNPAVSLLAKDAGYRAACTTVDGVNDSTADLYELKRTEITGRDANEEFKRKLERDRD
ncbi:MAG: polysaccharide deacetylase family protein [Candidatus Omnitrophica bacterium]|nr:polysaccharide deacetylase family protein [Candidatus Omnitrophota bacterium]